MLINHLAPELLHGIKVNKERTHQIYADSFILTCHSEATFLFSVSYHVTEIVFKTYGCCDIFLGRLNEWP